jgi:urea ABC transporter permease protein UrtB
VDQLTVVLIAVAGSVATLVIISLGLAVIFGMMRVINLAHGEFLMLGAFAALTFGRLGLGIWPSVLLAPIPVGLFGLLVERLLIRFLYGRILDTMLATWGLSLILVQAMVLIFGPATHGIGEPLGHLRLGAYSVSQYSMLMIAVAALLLALVYVLFARTPYGLMARAATQNPEMASAVGIDIGRTNMVTFAVGSALAGAGGALLAPLAGVVPSMGQAYVAQAFMTVVVGGQGVLLGTSAAAGLLGSAYSLLSFVLTPFLGQAGLLLLAIVLVRLRPRGLSAGWKRLL